MIFSQNGFPALDSGHPKLHRWEVPGTQRYFVLRNGSAGFILCCFILWFHRKIERLNKRGKPWDEWAYAYRPIRGTVGTVSNHGSGTAVDLNATEHPLGVGGTFLYKVRGILAVVRIHLRLRRKFRNSIRWGGDYRTRKDEMHFEINCDLVKCERVAKRLMKTKIGKEILKANPGQKRIILS